MLEELGSDAHVFFRVDASRVAAEARGRCGRRHGSRDRSRVAPQRARRSRARERASGTSLRLAVDPSRFHFFDADTGVSLLDAARLTEARPASPVRSDRGVLVLTTPGCSVTMTRVTKQAETRDLVLDLIEQLAVGEAIPSERQLSADFGVSRLTVRAALDDLVREGHLVRRHGSGTFVSEPKIAQELTMTSFTDDMRSRGLSPASETLDLRTVPAGARLGRLLHVSPSEPVLVAERLRLADGESMAIETVHIRASLVPGLTARDLEERSFYELLQRSLRDRGRRGRADDRADGHRRGRVARPRRAAAFACVPLRARHALGGGRDRRVRRLDLPGRPVPSDHGPFDPAGPSASACRRSRRASVVGSSLAWLIPTRRATVEKRMAH